MSGALSIVVFDVGGSHIAAALFNTEDKVLHSFKTSPVISSVPADQVLDVFGRLAHEVSAGEKCAGLGVAMPAPFDYEAGVSYMEHKYRSLYGVSLRKELAHRTGCEASRIHFFNDADSFLAGELASGAAVGSRRTVGITLGTGVGSAFAVNGEIVTSGAGVPPGGEIWNFPYQGGIVEDVISTRTLQSLYEKKTGSRKDVREIAGEVASDAAARETFEQFGHDLGKALRAICGEFKPDRIVLGGGIARSALLFLPFAEKEVAGLPFTLKVSELDHRAPLIGVGISWIRQHLSPASAT